MRFSITVLCTLVLALVARGIPIPTSGDEGSPTPPSQAPEQPTAPQQQPPQQQASTSSVGANYTPRTGETHRGDVVWVQPSRFDPPEGNDKPHPFVVTKSPSPGGTTHGLSATHGTIGNAEDNRNPNDYLPQGHPTTFRSNAEGVQPSINIRNAHRTNSRDMYDSHDKTVPTNIPEPERSKLINDHEAMQTGSTSRPKLHLHGVARGVLAGLGMARGGSGRGRGDPQSSTNESNRGRSTSRGGRGGHEHGTESRGSSTGSRGSSTSRRGASADSLSKNRQHPYKKHEKK